MRGKARRIGEGLERAGEVEPTGVECRLQRFEEKATEATRQDTDREEESRSTGDPPGAIGREAAAGDDTMEMRVMHQGLSPGVQHGEEPDRGPEMARIGGDGAERVCGRVEEDAIDHRFVLCGDLGDGLGYREHDVKVLAVEQVGRPVLDPRGAGQRLAAGAMPIAAAVVPDPGVPAVVALLDMAAERGGAARRNRGHDAPLGG